MAAPRLKAFFIFATTLLLFLGSFTAFSQKADETIQFTYSGATGPDQWGNLNPNFSMCVNGKAQSPINILTAKVRYPGNSGALIVDNKMYTLKQMHWHAPSEHRIDGQQFAAELHLVHIADDGSVSVVAILFKYGQPDPLLAKIQSKLNELAYEVKSHEETPINLGPFHPTEVRKRCHKYYRYVGSFTTPPCTQNVIWNILAKVRTISRGQVQALQAPLDMRCKKNARSCQPMNDRHVELYDEDIIAQGGHFPKD
ncbi:hypothetical protein DH2020_039869 [Rehmannia glutinosa]|uniref:Carbonic anhydrase n=1 Tax=Rehmannia glutinosa TaxID=99300 RepID=A0ABR0UWA7_REHGL